jgi:hypothetical protein
MLWCGRLGLGLALTHAQGLQGGRLCLPCFIYFSANCGAAAKVLEGRMGTVGAVGDDIVFGSIARPQDHLSDKHAFSPLRR